MITDKMINDGLDGKIEKLIKEMLVSSFDQRLILAGSRVTGTEVYQERNASTRSWDIMITAEELPDASLHHLLVRADVQKMHLLATILRVNEISWWRFLWLKLRGKPVVEFQMERLVA